HGAAVVRGGRRPGRGRAGAAARGRRGGGSRGRRGGRGGRRVAGGRGRAGELHVVLGEVPGVLRHAAAGAGGGAIVVRRRALPVAVDRPEGVAGEAVRGGEVQHGLEVRLVEVLAAVAAPVHHRDALVRVRGAGVPAEGAHQQRVERLERGDLRRGAVEAAVERHDREVVGREAVRLGLVEQLLAEPAGAGGGSGRGDGDVEARVVPLEDLRGADLVGDRRAVLVLRLLQVEVDRVQPVLVDDLLVRGGGGRGAASDLAELGAVVAAGRDGDVTARRPDGADGVGDGAVGGDGRGAVPGGRTGRAVREHEGELERLDAGGGHDVRRVGRVVVERHQVGRGGVPVAAERGGGGRLRVVAALRGGEEPEGGERCCGDSGEDAASASGACVVGGHGCLLVGEGGENGRLRDSALYMNRQGHGLDQGLDQFP